MKPLPWPDASHRAGLLLGASLFLADGCGLPWSHGLFGVAALPIAVLLVAMPALSWMRLGDWRDARRGSLLAASTIPVWMVVAAAITPELRSLTPPGTANRAAATLAGGSPLVPFGAMAASLAGAIVAFTHLMALLISLRVAWKPGRPIASVVALVLPGALAVLYHSGAETLVGLLLLGWFFACSHEIALLLPAHMEAALDDRDRAFLAHLRTRGRMREAEAPLLLPRGLERLAELEALGLVHHDRGTGELTPDAAAPQEVATATRRGSWLARGAWIAAGALYLLLPDLLPGPIDDLVVMLLCSYAGLRPGPAASLSRESASGNT